MILGGRMKQLLLLTFFSALIAQPTNVILYKVHTQSGLLTAEKVTEITDDSDYSNQPAFTSDSKYLMFVSGELNKQTDIYYYDIDKEETEQLTFTKDASEYSPIEYRKNVISMVRIDPDRKQRVHLYDVRTRKFKSVGDITINVGYHAWFNQRTLAICHIERPFSLRLIDTQDGTTKTIIKWIGRTLLKHPTQDGILFIENGDEYNHIRFLELKGEKSAIHNVANMKKGALDFAVMSDGTYLMGHGTKLMKMKPGSDTKWIEVMDVEDDYGKISRIAVSPDQKYVAIVVDEG